MRTNRSHVRQVDSRADTRAGKKKERAAEMWIKIPDPAAAVSAERARERDLGARARRASGVAISCLCR